MLPLERQPTGFWFEMGAHTLYNSYGSLLSIIDELGLRDACLTRQKAPFRLLVDGKLRSIPSQLSLPELFASAWHAFSERKQGRTVPTTTADWWAGATGSACCAPVRRRAIATDRQLSCRDAVQEAHAPQRHPAQLTPLPAESRP